MFVMFLRCSSEVVWVVNPQVQVSLNVGLGVFESAAWRFFICVCLVL